MDYRNNRARNVEPYIAGEQPQDKRYIKLNTNENAYPPSPRVAQAIAAEIGRLNLYPAPDSDALVETIAALNGFTPSQVFVGNGSDEVLALAFQTFFDGERPIAYPAVTYSFYPVWAQVYGVDALPVPMLDGLAVDADALIGCGRAVVLANPNAPTSLALGRDVIRGMAAALRENGHLLLLDEAYAAFGAQSCEALVHEYDNVLIVRTLSKSHALAGLRVAYALGAPPLIEALRAMKDAFNSYPLDRLAQAGALTALLDADYYAQTNAAIVKTRDAFMARLRGMGFEVMDSKTNFVFASHPAQSAAALFRALKDGGILVRYFSKPPIDNYLRISIGDDEQMDSVARCLEEIVCR